MQPGHAVGTSNQARIAAAALLCPLGAAQCGDTSKKGLDIPHVQNYLTRDNGGKSRDKLDASI